MFTLVLALVLGQNTDSATLPFIKLDSLGVNPLNNQEKIIFDKTCGEKMVREFKETPVYLVSYSKTDKNKIESKYEQVSTASCVFITDKWVTASIKTNKSIPENYVLRARTVSNNNKVVNDVLKVQSASIVEFYLKPKDMAVEFK